MNEAKLTDFTSKELETVRIALSFALETMPSLSLEEQMEIICFRVQLMNAQLIKEKNEKVTQN